MRDLRAQLQQCCQGRVCFVALGGSNAGDDAFGIRLAKKLASEMPPGGQRQILVAGLYPERHLNMIAEKEFDNVVFLDAVDLGTAPGSVAVLDADQMKTLFPQVTTHRVSLGLLAKAVEGSSRVKVWLVAAQPESLKKGDCLSKPVAKAVELVHHLLAQGAEEPAC